MRCQGWCQSRDWCQQVTGTSQQIQSPSLWPPAGSNAGAGGEGISWDTLQMGQHRSYSSHFPTVLACALLLDQPQSLELLQLGWREPLVLLENVCCPVHCR